MVNLYHMEWLILGWQGLAPSRVWPLGSLLCEQEGGYRSRWCPQYLLCFWFLGCYTYAKGKSAVLREVLGGDTTASHTNLHLSSEIFTTNVINANVEL